MAEQRPGSMEMIATTAQPGPAAPIASDADGRPFVFMSAGTSNSYLVASAGGDVLINAGMDFEAPVHRRKFAAVRGGPLRWIVLTQGHVDHVGGVGAFRGEGARVIAQRNSRRCQEDDRRIRSYRHWRSAVFFGRGVRVTAPEPVEPDIAFDRFHAFELDGRRFELHAAPGGETIDSCCVHLPDHGILFSGNILGPLFPTFPNLYTIPRRQVSLRRRLHRDAGAADRAAAGDAGHRPLRPDHRARLHRARADAAARRGRVRAGGDAARHERGQGPARADARDPAAARARRGPALRQGLVGRARDLRGLRRLVPLRLDHRAAGRRPDRHRRGRGRARRPGGAGATGPRAGSPPAGRARRSGWPSWRWPATRPRARPSRRTATRTRRCWPGRARTCGTCAGCVARSAAPSACWPPRRTRRSGAARRASRASPAG